MSSVKSGYSCIYKVLYPERGTLELKEERGEIVISQFKLMYNSTPSDKSIAYVKSCINVHGIYMNTGIPKKCLIKKSKYLGGDNMADNKVYFESIHLQNY